MTDWKLLVLLARMAAGCILNRTLESKMGISVHSAAGAAPGYSLMKPIALLVLLAPLAAAQRSPGQALFSQHCAVCHGAAGEGGSGPDLTNPLWQRSLTDDQLERAIRDGRPSPGGGPAMPAFQDRINAAGRTALVAHLRGLAASAIQPGNALVSPEIHVSWDSLKNPDSVPDQWLMYGRDSGNQRFSPLREITRANVRNLVPVWSF